LFGVLAVGGVATVVNERNRPRQIEHVLRHSMAHTLVTKKEMLDRQPRPLETEASVLDVSSFPTRGELEPVGRVSGDLAQIIYTSGSTGLPKGVAFSHGALHAGVDAVAGYLELQASDRIASLLPFSSVYGLNQLLCAINVRAALLIEQSPLPHQIVANLRQLGVTVLAGVPPLWLQLLSVPAFVSEPIETLRILQNAGGHLPHHAVHGIRQAQPHARLFLQYGQTETFRGTFLPPEDVDVRPTSMGRAIPSVEILVLRDDGTPCEPGEVGELVHRGPTLASGYWNDPEATETTFRPCPCRPIGTPAGERAVFSGDMVKRDEQGFLYFVSRRDRLIKTLGFRVGPDEISDVLFASGEISECVVTTEADPQRGERIVAFVILSHGGSLGTLSQFIRSELPRHMQPARVQALDVMPRMPSGKYDLAALRAGAVPA
jgi:acyl-coenzyme A synthetase/AMP-(fatty) acid ligase